MLTINKININRYKSENIKYLECIVNELITKIINIQSIKYLTIDMNNNKLQKKLITLSKIKNIYHIALII